MCHCFPSVVVVACLLSVLKNCWQNYALQIIAKLPLDTFCTAKSSKDIDFCVCVCVCLFSINRLVNCKLGKFSAQKSSLSWPETELHWHWVQTQTNLAREPNCAEETASLSDLIWSSQCVVTSNNNARVGKNNQNTKVNAKVIINCVYYYLQSNGEAGGHSIRECDLLRIIKKYYYLFIQRFDWTTVKCLRVSV